jgi:hypothetical protein
MPDENNCPAEVIPEVEVCWYCGGEGYGIIGTVEVDSGDSDDRFSVKQRVCPCCGGSGKASDCTFC